MTQFSAAFQVDTDHVGTVESQVASIDTGGPFGGLVVTVTTVDPHGYTVGEEVTLVGLPDDFALFNGAHPITAVTTSTFSFVFSSTVAAGVTTGQAFSPSPSYIRYHPADTLLDNAAGLTTLYVQPWDYNTLRIVWGMDPALDRRAALDISNGLTPLVVITRSGFGYPVTPLDGVQVLVAPYQTTMAARSHTTSTAFFETMAPNAANDWNRPPLPVQSLYDRNLPSGHWFYYTLFLYLGSYDAEGVPLSDPITSTWVIAHHEDTVTPVNSHHAERLYDLIPDYYQVKDQEFLAGTGRRGVVERLTEVIGFEVDITKTLADGVEHVYDIDHVHDDMMHSQGVFNFGVPVETSLGDARYRAILATVSRLYDERGSVAGLAQLVPAATKYRCKILDGLNMMNLTDDAEFAADTGAWGEPFPVYEKFITSLPWLDRPITSFNTVNLTAVSLITTPEGGSDGIVPRRNAMLVGGAIHQGFDSLSEVFDGLAPFDGATPGEIVSSVDFDDGVVDFDYPVAFDGLGQITDGVLIACGLGEGFAFGRRHEVLDVHFLPRTHGIKCHPGTTYTFSGYSVLEKDPGGPTGGIAIGIMWFNEERNGVFNAVADYISKAESSPLVTESVPTDPLSPGPFKRYSIDATAPLSLRGQPHVFAVPYFVFADSFPRYVSACMFLAQLNSAGTFALPTISYLHLGVPSEPLGSPYVLGEPG